MIFIIIIIIIITMELHHPGFSCSTADLLLVWAQALAPCAVGASADLLFLAGL